MSAELLDNLKYVVDSAREELAERLTAAVKEEVEKQIDVEEMLKQVDVPHLVRRAVYDDFRQSVANEIGNRLRCGVYDGTQVDKLFESVWTSELDKCIKERIRSQVYKAVDEVITERLKSLRDRS